MLGSSMVPALAAAGHRVYPTDLRPDPPARALPRDFDLHAASCAKRGRTDRSTHEAIAPMVLLDVRREDHVAECVDRIEPELILHLAAETDVDLCESRPDHAYATNALGTEIV